MDDVDERSRLLPPQPDEDSGDAPAATSSRPETSAAFPRRNLIHCILILTLKFLFLLSFNFQVTTLLTVLTRNVCHREHPEFDPGSPECFIDGEVRSELVLFTRWNYALNNVPGILTALPYGFLADQYGRKRGLYLSLVGVALSQLYSIIIYFWPDVFHPRLALISPFFMFIGGGSVVFSALLFAMLSDLAPDAYRTTTFFGIAGSVIAAGQLAPPLISILSEKNIWLPVFVGISLYIPIVAIALYLPETLDRKALPDVVAPDLADAALDNQEARDIDVQNHDRPSWIHRWRSFTEGIHSFRVAAISMFWGDRQIYYLVYFWVALSAILVLLVLPAVNYYLTTKVAMSPKKRDLLLARIGMIPLIVGYLVVGLAETSSFMLIGLGISCFGFPIEYILRGLLAQLVEGQKHGLLFTSIALVDNLGTIFTYLLMTLCFDLGQAGGGRWLGVPFLTAAFFFALATPILYYIRVM
ncbi:efflux pump ustT [Trichoderma asperellum]|uniref:Efflux pump ustT n=1 Tax=Trichoderma asperellum TaxID=101201 RepID=A0A6V8QW93_TRIAP|nr:efflux pump ustT [Trichoderma asperellum]